eukprot:237612-Chlamydomonas_euryale.AAC.1
MESIAAVDVDEAGVAGGVGGGDAPGDGARDAAIWRGNSHADAAHERVQAPGDVRRQRRVTDCAVPRLRMGTFDGQDAHMKSAGWLSTQIRMC